MAGANSSTLQPRYASQMSSPRAKSNAEQPHGFRHLQQHVEIQGGAAPEIGCVRFQKGLRGPSPLIVQQGEEFPFSIELGGSAELGHHLARDPVDSHAGPLGTFAVARIRDFPKHRDHAQFFQQNGVERHFIHTVRISDAERGYPPRSTGLICTRMVSCDLHSLTRGVIVGLPE